MRVLFAGTPQIAVPALDALAGSSHDVVGVLSAPDRPGGRGRELVASPVKARAIALSVPVLQPERLDADARQAVRELRPDALACFAYGKIFGPRFLELFSGGALNVHPSLLPRYRGPAPIPAAIINRDDRTGVTVQQIAAEMDAGDIVVQRAVTLDGSETTESLGEYLASIGAALLVEALDRIESGSAVYTPQNHRAATYTRLLDKNDGRIDWTRSAPEIDALVRASIPWPKAYTSLATDRLVVLEALVVSPAGSGEPGRVRSVDTTGGILVETGNGVLGLQKLQVQSRKALDWRSFVNGMPQIVGSLLGGS